MRAMISSVWMMPVLLTGALACSEGDFAGSAGKKQADKNTDDDAADDDQDDEQDDEQNDGQDDDGADDSGAGDDGSDDDDEGLGDGSDSDADLGTEAKDDISSAVDSACAGGVVGAPPVAPKGPSLPNTAPSDCRNGIEFNNYQRKAFKLTANESQKAQTPIEIDIASYTAEDHIKLVAETESGERVIMDTCRLRTATYADPTNGKSRPPEDSIREFRLKLPKNTKALRFDFTDATSPTYMRIIGLCNFNLTPVQVDGNVPTLRPVSD